MKLAIARAVMALVVRCMGVRRHEWSQAMLVEFDAAAEAGEPLSFAVGCLLAAGRELPAHEEGRFVMASHVLALGVLVPVAAVLIFGVATGQPYLSPEYVSPRGGLGHRVPALAINDGNQAGLPPMAALTFILGLGHLYVAWAMLDRRWTRVGVAGRIAAAMTLTSAIFTGLMFLQVGDAMPQAGAVIIELFAIWTLIRWHGELSDADPGQPEPSFC